MKSAMQGHPHPVRKAHGPLLGGEDPRTGAAGERERVIPKRPRSWGSVLLDTADWEDMRLPPTDWERPDSPNFRELSPVESRELTLGSLEPSKFLGLIGQR